MNARTLEIVMQFATAVFRVGAKMPAKYWAAGSLASAAALFASFEGYRERAYLDTGGVWTICAGSTRGVYEGMIASPAECAERLDADVRAAAIGIASCVRVPITGGQFDALVSFAGNVGVGAACGSTLVRKLNAGDCVGAAAEFDRWVYDNGKVVGHLKNTRRPAERRVFEAGC